MIRLFYSSVNIFNRMLCFGCALTNCSLFSFLFLMVQLERGLHGIEPVVVANFPTKKYSDDFFSAAEDAQYVVSFIVEFLNVLAFMRLSQILFYIGDYSSFKMIVCVRFAGCVILLFYYFWLNFSLWWATGCLSELLIG